MKKIATFSLYLGNDTRHGHSYYGMQQETLRKLSSGTIFNDIEQPQPIVQCHGIILRWIHQKRYEIQNSYNVILIGIYTRPTQGTCHLEWYSEIFNEASRDPSATAELLVTSVTQGTSRPSIRTPTWTRVWSADFFVERSGVKTWLSNRARLSMMLLKVQTCRDV